MVRDYLAGRPMPDDYNAPWAELIRGHRKAGRIMRRFKVVRRPFTDYTRHLFAWAIPVNTEAGEDYRIIDATDREVGLPEQDFWVFDDSRVALLNFDGSGQLLGRELAPEGDLQRYRRWLDVAMAESVPFREYRV
jgi:hypothetical protein